MIGDINMSKNDTNTTGRTPLAGREDWTVETRPVEEFGKNIGKKQVDLVVRADESYTYMCGACGGTYEGSLRKEDVVNGFAECPARDTKVPLMATARGGPRIYRFTPVNSAS